MATPAISVTTRMTKVVDRAKDLVQVAAKAGETLTFPEAMQLAYQDYQSE